MAKKKSKKRRAPMVSGAPRRYKATHRRRRSKRSSSQLGAIDTTNLLTTAIGALGAKFLNKVIPSTVNSSLVAGGKIAVGVFLPMLSKDGKTKNMLTGVANGFIAVGTIELVESFGVTLEGLGAADDTTLAVALEGIEDIEFEEVETRQLGENVLGEEVLGANDLQVVNGNDLDVINADDQDGMDDGDDDLF